MCLPVPPGVSFETPRVAPAAPHRNRMPASEMAQARRAFRRGSCKGFPKDGAQPSPFPGQNPWTVRFTRGVPWSTGDGFLRWHDRPEKPSLPVRQQSERTSETDYGNHPDARPPPSRKRPALSAPPRRLSLTEGPLPEDYARPGLAGCPRFETIKNLRVRLPPQAPRPGSGIGPLQAKQMDPRLLLPENRPIIGLSRTRHNTKGFEVRSAP